MAIKSMLKRMFTGYGMKAAKKASYRGCYEAPVPESVSVRLVTKQLKNHKLHK